jgi:hypothetical protein
MLMGTATHLAPIDQRPSIAKKKAAPDLLARFQPPFSDHVGPWIPPTAHGGFRCLVEIKSTKENTFRIRGGALKRLRTFADAFSLPLVFAVRFTTFSQIALWKIVEDKDRSKGSLIVDSTSILSGLRVALWHEHGYGLFPDSYLVRTYDSQTTCEGLRSQSHGTLVGLRICNRKGEFDVPEDNVTSAAFFLEAFHAEEVETKTSGTVTQTAGRFQVGFTTVADLLFVLNRLVRDEDGNVMHDPLVALRQLADGQKPTLLDRRMVEAIGGDLCNLGAVALMGIGDLPETFAAWKRTGGVVPSNYVGPRRLDGTTIPPEELSG